MNRSEYIKRVLPVISSLGEQKTDMIMDKIAAYLVDAGEENETAAINALGVPEIFARKFLHSDGEYEIPPFVKPEQPEPEEKKDHSVFKMPSAPDKSGIDSKGNLKFALVLVLLVITCPLWAFFFALIAVLALVFAVAVTLLLLIMTVGGVALTVIGVIKLFRVLPVGLMLCGIGLILLGIAAVAFVPLLSNSVRLLCETVKDVFDFVRDTIKRANSIRTEANS